MPFDDGMSGGMYEAPLIVTPNLISGVGHGHYRPFDRERPAKDRVKKLRKHTKMKKASKRRNRK